MDFPLGTSTNTFSKPNGDSNDLLIRIDPNWSNQISPNIPHILRWFSRTKPPLGHGDFAEGRTCPCPCPLGPWRMPLAPLPLLGKLSDRLLDHWKGIHRRWNYGTMGVFTASKRCNPSVFPCWWFDYMCSTDFFQVYNVQTWFIETLSINKWGYLQQAINDAWLMIRDEIILYI